MLADVDNHIQKAKKAMEDGIEHLITELGRIRTGKAANNMLDSIMVDYYGAPTPLSQVASVTTADARTLLITPWEKKMVAAIERAIFEANVGMTPQNDGTAVRLNIPPLTEDRRREMVKKAKQVTEDSKVGIRNSRRDVMDFIKKSVKDGLPEDMGKRKEGEVDDITKKFIEKCEQLSQTKEKDIMTV